MTRAMTLMALAGAAAAGAGIGAHLGRAAIAEINPIYYSEPPSGRFFADLTPNPYALAVADQPAGPLGNDLDVAGEQSCLDCAANLVDPLYASSVPAPSNAPPPVAVSPAIAAPAIAVPVPGPPMDIVRYASFPVSQGEALGTASPPKEPSQPLGM